MDIGKLNKRIEIWHYTESVNEMYKTIRQETFLFKLWAEIMDIRGIKQTGEVADDVKYSYKIKVRYTDKIAETMTVKYQGRSFKINACINVGFRNRELLLLCEEVIG